jgi:uncharacterized protein YbbK (DUF523 family)
MQHVLVSACLLGSPVRYDGGHRRSDAALLQQWLAQGRVVPLCPEVAGGLPVPRPAAEIAAAAGGAAVLAGRARVLDAGANDVSAEFIAGARRALELVRANQIRVAVLKEGSPSCGSGSLYDGSFSGSRVPGRGVTAAALEGAGIRVFSEAQLAQAHELLMHLEAGSAD